MLVAVQPDVVLESRRVYCTVALAHGYTRGQMVVDWRGQLERPANVEVVFQVDRERFRNSLIHMLLAQ